MAKHMKFFHVEELIYPTVNTMTADGLAPCNTRASVATVLTMSNPIILGTVWIWRRLTNIGISHVKDKKVSLPSYL